MRPFQRFAVDGVAGVGRDAQPLGAGARRHERRDGLRGDRLGLRPGLGEARKLGEALEVAAGREDDLDLAGIGEAQRLGRAGPEQVGVLGRVDQQVDRPGAEAGATEAGATRSLRSNTCGRHAVTRRREDSSQRFKGLQPNGRKCAIPEG